MLRQLTPGFDETSSSNFALLSNILNNECNQNSCFPTTVEEDSSLFGQSIRKINCTPVGQMSLSRLNNEFETVVTRRAATRLENNNNKSYLSSRNEILAKDLVKELAKELVYSHGSVLPPSTKWNPKQMQSAKKETDEDEQDVLPIENSNYSLERERATTTTDLVTPVQSTRIRQLNSSGNIVRLQSGSMSHRATLHSG